MKRVKKPVFFVVVSFIVVFTALTFFGIHTQYGDVQTTVIRGLNDIRWGIDIRGGVDVTFTSPADYDATDNEIDAAKSIVETRLVDRNITDYELYVDYSSDRIIVRFPWQAEDELFDPETAVKELGEMAELTFREGVGEDKDELPLVLSGNQVEKAEARYDSSQQSGSRDYEVVLKLTEDGAKKFDEATKKLYDPTGANPGRISIWMDDICISAPKVEAHITDDEAVISGPTIDAQGAIDLATKINGGALPFKLEADTFRSISPSLGMGARDAMGLAAVIAFAVIAFFMIFNYRLPGVVAVIGLVGLVAGTVSAITGFFPFSESFTLTIPGIAGIILSIGMGVDANVITAERIKEEINSGKTVDNAISIGFKRAFTAIFDGNITMIIIAIILMGAFGTPDSFAAKLLTPIFFAFGPSTAGAIYSFGYTLMVGVILNFVFGIFCSRLMTSSLSRFKPFRNPVLYGGKKNEK